jgi:hypothetical protein
VLEDLAVVVDVLTAVEVDLVTTGEGGSLITSGFCGGWNSLACITPGLFFVSVDTFGGSACRIFFSTFFAFSRSSAWTTEAAPNAHATIVATVSVNFVFIVSSILFWLILFGTSSRPKQAHIHRRPLRLTKGSWFLLSTLSPKFGREVWNNWINLQGEDVDCIDCEPETCWDSRVVSPRQQHRHAIKLLLESDDFPWLQSLCGTSSSPKDRRKLILNLLRAGLTSSTEPYSSNRSSTGNSLNENQNH